MRLYFYISPIVSRHRIIYNLIIWGNASDIHQDDLLKVKNILESLPILLTWLIQMNFLTNGTFYRFITETPTQLFTSV